MIKGPPQLEVRSDEGVGNLSVMRMEISRIVNADESLVRLQSFEIISNHVMSEIVLKKVNEYQKTKLHIRSQLLPS